jgi:hypothetical protein
MKNFKIFFALFLSIFSSSSSFHIQCRFNANSWWEQLGYIYNCEVTSSSLMTGLNVTQISGIHLQGRSDFDVQGIFFMTNCAHVNTIPRNVRDFFPNLIAINMRGCGINSLNGDELQPYENLLSFSLTNSLGFVHIPGHLFVSTPHMLAVAFDNNRINRVGRDLLSNLRHLQAASFFSNVCINNGAFNMAQVVGLIEDLRQRCSDPNDFTTTVISTTTELISTTTNEFGCVQGNYGERICALEVENENLRDEIRKMKDDISYLAEAVLNLKSRPCAC